MPDLPRGAVPVHRPEYGDTPGWAVPTNDPREVEMDAPREARSDIVEVFSPSSYSRGDGTTMFDYPLGRRVEQFDYLALWCADLAKLRDYLEDHTGLYIPLAFRFIGRTPVHDLPMDFEHA